MMRVRRAMRGARVRALHAAVDGMTCAALDGLTRKRAHDAAHSPLDNFLYYFIAILLLLRSVVAADAAAASRRAADFSFAARRFRHFDICR